MSAVLSRSNYLLPTRTDGVVILIYDGRPCNRPVLAGGYIAIVTNRNNPETWVPSNFITQLCPGQPYRYGLIEVRWDGNPTTPGLTILYRGTPIPLLSSVISNLTCGTIPPALSQVTPCPFTPGPPTPLPQIRRPPQTTTQYTNTYNIPGQNRILQVTYFTGCGQSNWVAVGSLYPTRNSSVPLLKFYLCAPSSVTLQDYNIWIGWQDNIPLVTYTIRGDPQPVTPLTTSSTTIDCSTVPPVNCITSTSGISHTSQVEFGSRQNSSSSSPNSCGWILIILIILIILLIWWAIF